MDKKDFVLEIIMLDFINPFLNVNFNKLPSNWIYDYSAKESEEIIESLLKKDLIKITQDLKLNLELLTINSLKTLLKTHNLKLDGEKEDLILRIINYIPKDKINIELKSIYILTNYGKELVKKNEDILFASKSYIPRVNVENILAFKAKNTSLNSYQIIKEFLLDLISEFFNIQHYKNVGLCYRELANLEFNNENYIESFKYISKYIAIALSGINTKYYNKYMYLFHKKLFPYEKSICRLSKEDLKIIRKIFVAPYSDDYIIKKNFIKYGKPIEKLLPYNIFTGLEKYKITKLEIINDKNTLNLIYSQAESRFYKNNPNLTQTIDFHIFNEIFKHENSKIDAFFKYSRYKYAEIITPLENYYDIKYEDYGLETHKDLLGLIWFKKYNKEAISAIYKNFEYTKVKDVFMVESPSSFASFKALSKEQKYVYKEFLKDPYNNKYPIGYVFLLFYGLERFLFTNRYKKAFNVILKLRDAHKDLNFQSYSLTALFIGGSIHYDRQLLTRLKSELEKNPRLDEKSLFLKYIFDEKLNVDDIISLCPYLEFNDYRYINNHYDVFKKIMEEILIEKYNGKKLALSKYNISKAIGVFELKLTNYSLSSNIITIDIPNIFTVKEFKNDLENLLNETNNLASKKIKYYEENKVN